MGGKSDYDVLLAAAKGFEGFPIVVELDREANYKRIRNLDGIALHMRTLLRPVFADMEKGAKASIATADEGQKAKEARDAAVLRTEATLASMTTPQAVEAILTNVIQTYNAFVGAELEEDASYTLDTELDNPFGGKKFPAKFEFGMHVSKTKPGDVFMEWRSTIDPKKGLDATWEVVEKLYGAKLSKAQRKELPKQISIEDDGFALFERESGVIEMFETTRTVHFGDEYRVRRNRMRLVDSEHDHEWVEQPGEENDTERYIACSDATSAPGKVVPACTALLDDVALAQDERIVALFARAHAHGRSNDLTAALRDLDALLALEPRNAIAVGMRGMVHGMRGDLSAALRDFDKALALDPRSVDSLQNRGKVLSDTGEHARAIADFSRAIELAPDNAIARNGRCWSQAILGKKLDIALADCDESIRLAPKDGNHFNTRAFVRFRGGDYAGAIRDYDAAIALDPKAASSYYMRGRAKAMLGDASASLDIDRGIAGEAGIAARYEGYGIDSK